MSTFQYQIEGSDLQYVEVTLEPGQSAVGEPGAMMYLDEGVSLETRMGRGHRRSRSRTGAARRYACRRHRPTPPATCRATGSDARMLR
jgi:uncharacterized protein (AIM24 family)